MPEYFQSHPSSRSLGEISCFKDEIEIELEKSRPKLRGIYAAYAKEMGMILSRCTNLSTDPGHLRAL